MLEDVALLVGVCVCTDVCPGIGGNGYAVVPEGSVLPTGAVFVVNIVVFIGPVAGVVMGMKVV